MKKTDQTVERFLRYVSYETTSTEQSEMRPSSLGQKALGSILAKELADMGLQDVHISLQDGAVFGTIPANTDASIPTLGFLAHMDTSDAASGKNVRPRIVEDYCGGEIELSPGIRMSPAVCTCLNEVVGEDLIVTDGTTLLGADDKAGIAEIMTMAEELLHTEKPHGTVKVCFTSDEEIGQGPDLFDVPAFGCDYAYTVDGGPLGEVEFENFNAATVIVTVHGVSVHPGTAKGLMKNAAAMATEYHGMLPTEQTPEHTADYEGFIHLMHMQGDVTEAKLLYIVRDHDLEKLREKVVLMQQAGAFMAAKYGAATVVVDAKETYYNMKEKILPHMHLIHVAEAAFREYDVIPKRVPVRGGTDGARLSFEGLPCPNLSTGGYQFHGVYEFIPVRALETMPKVLCSIVYAYGKGEQNHV